MKTKIEKASVLIGSDFEMFLQDKNGKIISAIPFISGTKENPEPIEGHPGCCIQHDGVLAECNIPPVKLNEWKLFTENIEIVKEYIKDKFANEASLELICCPTAILEPDQLQSDEANQIGCSPDYNAWAGGELNNKPEFDGSGLRSSGFHIHFSFPNADLDRCLDLMKLFDVFVTMPFVLMDKDTRRRELYGKAGAFRLCDWGENKGFEARTLSNFALSNDQYIEYVFNQINKMFDYYNENTMDDIESLTHDIIKAINESNEDLAGQICEHFGIHLLIGELEECI